MTRRREALYIGLATLIGLYLFFIEFLPPIRKFHLLGDIEGYHYPLLNYAFKSLKLQHRFPLWDPTIYCGLSFAGNIQAQLFYPFTWLLFAAQWHRTGLAFMAVQIFAISHVWIALQLAYWWLRNGRSLPIAAALLGATTFALTGYVLNDFQHLGVICALTWSPLALWGVDRRRTWMIALAGALVFTAGYPATWLAIAIGVFFYALLTCWRFTWKAAAAMLFSLLIAGIQLLPTAELASLRPREPVYGIPPPAEWHWRHFYPNSIFDNGQYLYYGAAFLIAIVLGAAYADRRRLLPALCLAAAGLLFFRNPFHLIETVAGSLLPTLLDVMQHWNFLVILSAAAALFVALAWTPLAKSHPRLVLALIPLFWLEQYAFGGRREYFRQQSNPDRFFLGDQRIGGPGMRGLDSTVLARLQAHPESRILSAGNLHGTEFRHYLLTTPNGFDPFVTVRLREEAERFQPFETNRLFRVPVNNAAMLQAFGVRYIIAAEQDPDYNFLNNSPDFRKLQPEGPFFRVFEYLHAKPAYQFTAQGDLHIERWTPEHRDFHLDAKQPGDVLLLEHNLPGWRATLDGAPVRLELHSKAFQKIHVPTAGSHTIAFEYRPASLTNGAILSAVSTLILLVLTRRRL